MRQPRRFLDRGRKVGQLHTLLDRIEDYQPLIERNRQRLAETCTWDVHVAKMLAILGGRGYDVPGGRGRFTSEG